MNQENRYVADFETTTNEDDCRVWAFAICEVNNITNIKYGTNMKSFMFYCENIKCNPVIYFHNLKFDGEFIINYLLKNNFVHIISKRDRKDRTFSTLISDMGQFYSIEVYFKVSKSKIKKVTFYDSLKIFNFSVDEIAKTFHLETQKLKIDYEAARNVNHELTVEEKEYIKNDVQIVAQALKIFFDEGFSKITIGSNALSNYKKIISNKVFNNYFPKLSYNCDKDIRQSYRGGFTYLNPIYKEKKLKQKGIVLDVNSLYPSVMYNEYLPVKEPLFFNGKYKEDIIYPLYIQMISCEFKLKKNKIPTIQIKHNLNYIQNEYLKESRDITTLCLTNIDLELFFENYEVWNLTYHSGWKFRQKKRLI